MATKAQVTTSRRIILSAADLFHGDSFGSVSVDAIARDAGITKMTVYQHFRSKEEILFECLWLRLEQRESALDAWFAGKPADAAALLGLFDWMEGASKRGKFRGCAFLKAMNELSAALPEVRQVALDAKTLLRKRVVELAKAAGMPETGILGAEIAILLEGAQALAAVEQGPGPIRAARRAAEKLIFAHEQMEGAGPGGVEDVVATDRVSVRADA